eukprot:GFYU01003686.1.p1 GENE.GFYU01003686.1~~GFYU01003686.1.p1  ORF type:complete len:103 (-),score=25.84 GFYU01003686.1:205-513(-)
MVAARAKRLLEVKAVDGHPGDGNGAAPSTNARTQEFLDAMDKVCRHLQREAADKQCVVCYDNEKATLILPCRHYLLCQDCASGVHKCPYCRTPITDRLSVYD